MSLSQAAGACFLFPKAAGLRSPTGCVCWFVRYIGTSGFGFYGLAGLLVLIGLSGCAGEAAMVGPPRMPQVLAGQPKTPKPEVSRSEVLAQALAAAERDEMSAVMRAVEILPAGERGGLVRELIAGLARKDPARMGRVALALPAGPLQSGAVETAAGAMLERDPNAAVQWALAATEPAASFVARKAVAEQLVERDPRAAWERLRAWPATAARDEMLVFAVGHWARRDADSALARVRELPNGELKTHLTTSVGFAVAQYEPERAVEIAALLPEGRDRWLMLGAIGQTWVARNPSAAWQWAHEFPSGSARDAAISGVETGQGIARARRPVSGNGTFVTGNNRMPGGSVGAVASGRAPDSNSLPPGFERDELLRRQFEAALRESPVRAASWLNSLPLPDRRDEMVEQLARQWLRTDRRSAENWMDQNILSRARRDQLLEEVRR